MTSMSEVMEFLVNDSVPGLKPGVLADLFDRLVWITADNGEAIQKVRWQWLEGSDPLRIEIALLMNEMFPCGNRSDMEELFNKICSKWPNFRALCEQTLCEWDKQFKMPIK
jgi:hypothetical protein